MKQLIPILFLFLVSCKEKTPAIPEGILSQEKMKTILTEMHIADAVAENKAMGGANERGFTAAYYLQIYKNNSVTEDDFRRSYKFYEENPALLNEIYDGVLMKLSEVEPKTKK